MPKNIVLLSDGTGNSSAKLLKTNVWRVYESLQLANPRVQVACYDDGVGTSTFKPLALLGGAVGVGLRRNVLRLYRFLCEHYDPGDRIYLFGFSRGAFTVRILAGLICNQGIIKTRPTVPVEGATAMASPAGAAVRSSGVGPPAIGTNPGGDLAYGSELARRAAWAYREFRKEFRQTGGLVTAARWLRDLVFRTWDGISGHRAYDQTLNHQNVKIAFIGVWDTVDAYGLPVDELTQGVDRWIWPLSMPDLTLHENVARACHVLALDDERNTFHPLLWDESKEPQNCEHIRDERITQVWFAGMHSNVGGGYPDDALSAVSLAWMAEQVQHELRFVSELLAHHTAKADPLGRLYDSRSGLKGYYRYNPRRIEWLTNGQEHERPFFGGTWPRPRCTVTVARPKIHESVFTRMSAAPEAYAPFVFPETYAVLMDDGRILDGARNPFESPEAVTRRAAAQEAVWDLVWRRRIVYFTAVAVTAGLLLRPFRGGAEAAVQTPNAGTAGRVVATVIEWLPSYLSPWTQYFTARPWELFGGLAAVFVLSRIGGRQQAKMCHAMRGIWLKVIPPAMNQHQTLTDHSSVLLSMRSSRLYRAAFAVLRHTVLPSVFGIFVLVWMAAGANRLAFEGVNAAGWLCPAATAASGDAPRTLEPGERTRPLALVSGTFCNATGVQLDAGGRYEFQFTSGTPRLTGVQRAVFAALVPFRRVWSANWFAPVARIGRGGVDQYRLDAESVSITAHTTGELFLFVNDAILPVSVRPLAWGWDAHYENNHGTTTVIVTRLQDAH